MNEFETIIDYGAENLRLSVFNNSSENIYSSQLQNSKTEKNQSSEITLSTLIRTAEKHLSMHIDYVDVLYDTSKFKFIELSIKKTFDQPILFKKHFNSLIEEANFIIKGNHFKDQVIHIVISNITIDDNKTIETVSNELKTKIIILEIKYICLSKTIVSKISEKFKKNNLNISNIFCSSYVKTIFYKRNLDIRNNFIFLDIGFERTSAWFYYNSKFIFFNSISIGGNNITKDISKVLKLNIDYSELLKINFNSKEKDSYNKKASNQLNLYSEILEKNISVKILKQIIQARVDEIVELVVNKNNYFKVLSLFEKPSIIFIGSGSKLLTNTLDLKLKNEFSNLIFLEETDSMICEAGFNYNKTDESRLILPKDKSKKIGIFESFFNFFSK